MLRPKRYRDIITHPLTHKHLYDGKYLSRPPTFGLAANAYLKTYLTMTLKHTFKRIKMFLLKFLY